MARWFNEGAKYSQKDKWETGGKSPNEKNSRNLYL
jgi:hypothetical protein